MTIYAQKIFKKVKNNLYFPTLFKFFKKSYKKATNSEQTVKPIFPKTYFFELLRFSLGRQNNTC